jgi:molecular chaperone GrpE
MSEFPPPPHVGGPADGEQAALSDAQIDGVLAEFHTWLRELRLPTESAPPAEPPPDLATLLAQFVGLRHEVNLQTRAVRAQQEVNVETLRQLSDSLSALRQAREAPAAAADDDSLRPLLKTLVDLHDSLALTGRELERMRDAILDALPADDDDPTEPLTRALATLSRFDDERQPPAAPPTFWQRLTGRTPTAPESARPALTAAQEAIDRFRDRQGQRRQEVEKVGHLFDSLITGYAMSVQRLERALEQHGLEPIAAVGRRFDPEQMEVMEVVAAADHANNEVIEEIRRGYLYRGRVFRYALVRVARS